MWYIEVFPWYFVRASSMMYLCVLCMVIKTLIFRFMYSISPLISLPFDFQIKLTAFQSNLIANKFIYFFPDHMSSLCKNHYLRQVYRKIDGAMLWSQNERNLDCIITFQTDSILQRFMLRFDMLQLDCNDHLFVYDSAHAVGNHKVNLPNSLLSIKFHFRN